MSKNFLIILFISITLFFMLAMPSLGFHESELSILKQEASVYKIKANEYKKSGNIDKAITYYQKALLLDSRDVSLYNELGILYERKGLINRAEDMYIKAIEEEPLYSPAHNNLAYLYESQGEIAKAVAHWKIKVRLSREGDKWAEIAKEKLIEYSEGQEFFRKKHDTRIEKADKKKAEEKQEDMQKIENIARIDREYRPYSPIIDRLDEQRVIFFAEDIIEKIQHMHKQEELEKYNRHIIKGQIYYSQEQYRHALSEFQSAYYMNRSEELEEFINKTKSKIR